MKFYPPKISERFERPANAGKIENSNASGTGASFSCGSFVRIFLQIAALDKRIEVAKFQTNGCGYMVAAADVITENLTLRKLTDLHGVDSAEISGWLEPGLEEFPSHKVQCRDSVIEALKNALADYHNTELQEFQGEKALICTCFGVSEETIIAVISENSVNNADEVGRICNAGRGCGSCQMMIQEIIDSQDKEMG
ncbi:MAG: iron-sulfur cluster assembly scaffold protein [Pyrinomonadaceae bacterium]